MSTRSFVNFATRASKEVEIHHSNTDFLIWFILDRRRQTSHNSLKKSEISPCIFHVFLSSLVYDVWVMKKMNEIVTLPLQRLVSTATCTKDDGGKVDWRRRCIFLIYNLTTQYTASKAEQKVLFALKYCCRLAVHASQPCSPCAKCSTTRFEFLLSTCRGQNIPELLKLCWQPRGVVCCRRSLWKFFFYMHNLAEECIVWSFWCSCRRRERGGKLELCGRGLFRARVWNMRNSCSRQ